MSEDNIGEKSSRVIDLDMSVRSLFPHYRISLLCKSSCLLMCKLSTSHNLESDGVQFVKCSFDISFKNRSIIW